MSYEIIIDTDACESLERRAIEDNLVVLLARCGYSTYLSIDGGVAFTAEDDNVTKLQYVKEYE